MEKGKRNIINLLIVLISLLCVDGGSSLIDAGSRLHLLITRDHINDLDLPHHHHLVNLNDDERILHSSGIDFSIVNNMPVKFLFCLNNPSEDYSGPVWQPPRFI